VNVLVLCLSPGHGGLELYALREIEVLRERGIPCQAMVLENSMLARRLDEKMLPARSLSRYIPALPVLAARRVARFIEKQKIDVLHIHWAKDLPLAVLAKKWSSRPIRLVVSRHMALTRSKHDRWHRWQYQQVDCFITVTKLLCRQATRFLPLKKDRIQVLYLGVRTPDMVKPKCEQFFEPEKFPRRRLNLALFGRIEPYKGQVILIEAVRRLVEGGLDISATIVGHVMDQDYARQLRLKTSKYRLGQHVRFIEFIPDAASHMGCFDAVVLTTECETFGLVLIEAMSAGVAVIGTNAGGVPEIIDDGSTGLLTAAGDSMSLANAIARIYRSPELLSRLAGQGKQKAKTQFTESRHFDRLVELLGDE